MYAAMIPFPEPFVAGDTYLVTWDGTDYQCTAAELEGIAFLGNLGIAGLSVPSAEPFVMAVESDEEGCMLTIAAADSGASHTVAIRHMRVTIRPLAMELLPPLYLDGDTAMSFVEALNYVCHLIARGSTDKHCFYAQRAPDGDSEE